MENKRLKKIETEELVYANQNIKEVIENELLFCKEIFFRCKELSIKFEKIFMEEYNARLKDNCALLSVFSNMQQRLNKIFEDDLKAFERTALRVETENNFNEFLSYISSFHTSINKYYNGMLKYQKMSDNLEFISDDIICKNAIVMPYFSRLFEKHTELFEKLLDKNNKVYVEKIEEKEK